MFFDTEHRFGWRLNEAEIQGVPLILIVGQKEIDKGTITAKVRYSNEELSFQLTEASHEVQQLLNQIQSGMFQKASLNKAQLTTEVSSYEEFKEMMQTKRGFLKAFWCEDKNCEASIKEETKATTRCLPFIDDAGNVLDEKGVCVKCGKPATHRWLFAQAY